MSVFRARSRACKRRRTACWRRCAVGSEKSVGHLSFQIWRRWRLSCSKLWKKPLHQQRGWECCVLMNDIEPRLDGSNGFDSLRCLMVSLSLNWFLAAEAEVSDPHCEETRWRTQDLYHCSFARGTNTNQADKSKMQKVLFFFVSSSWGLRHFQVIICTKEVAVGTRKNAYNLLVEIGNAFVRFCGNTKGNSGLFGVRIIHLSGL